MYGDLVPLRKDATVTVADEVTAMSLLFDRSERNSGSGYPQIRLFPSFGALLMMFSVICSSAASIPT
jgi:hypothetical protein